MKTCDAINLINALAYKPGWRISAVAVPYETTKVCVAVEYTVPNSNRKLAEAGYPDEVSVSPVELFEVAEMDTLALLKAVLDHLIDIETHEAREFLRVPSVGWAAPFHPHRWSGESMWRAAGGQPSNHFRNQPKGNAFEGVQRELMEDSLASQILTGQTPSFA